MFDNAKAGDRVWSIVYGWGTVEAVSLECLYGIIVRFDRIIFKEAKCFTIDGKYLDTDILPTLFWDEIEFEIPKKPLGIDTKVLVWNKNSDTVKYKRYFSHFDKEKIHTFSDGATSWSSNTAVNTQSWDFWELAEDKEENK